MGLLVIFKNKKDMKKTNNANSGRAIANTGAFEHNAAMTELWQSNVEKLIASRDWGWEIDSKSLNRDIENLGEIVINLAFEAMWTSFPVRISAATKFDMVVQSGKALYRAIKYSQLDKHVKGELLLMFEEEWNLLKDSGRRKWFRKYLEWEKK